MKKIKVGSLFSGIGSFEFALKQLNIEHEILFACDNGEIELNIPNYDNLKFNFDNNYKVREKIIENIETIYENCRKINFVKNTYKANYEIDEKNFYNDVRFFDGFKFYKKLDILVGGSPCQSFSTVGNQGGLEDTRGTLFYEFARVIKESKPKVFIYENVRGLFTHDKGKTWEKIQNVFDSLGYKYHYKILDSKDHGIPQTRRRLFVIGFRNDLNIKEFIFPMPTKLKITVKDLLLENIGFNSIYYSENKIKVKPNDIYIPNDCFLSEKLIKYVMSGGTKSFYQKPEIDLLVARPILKTMGNSHRAGIDNYVTTNNKIRRLHEREVARLMGFSDDFKIIVSRSQAYKQFGNSIVVTLFIELLKNIYKTGVFDE